MFEKRLSNVFKLHVLGNIILFLGLIFSFYLFPFYVSMATAVLILIGLLSFLFYFLSKKREIPIFIYSTIVPLATGFMIGGYMKRFDQMFIVNTTILFLFSVFFSVGSNFIIQLLKPKEMLSCVILMFLFVLFMVGCFQFEKSFFKCYTFIICYLFFVFLGLFFYIMKREKYSFHIVFGFLLNGFVNLLLIVLLVMY